MARFAKRSLSLLVIMILLISMMCISASADSSVPIEPLDVFPSGYEFELNGKFYYVPEGNYVGYGNITSGYPVEVAQRALIYVDQNTYISCNPGDVDSSFGPSTYNAVYAFQQGVALSPDGVVGPNTWQALEDICP